MKVETEQREDILDRIANEVSRGEPTSEMQAYDIRIGAKLIRKLREEKASLAAMLKAGQ